MGRRTPLYDTHRALGAKIVEFAGWDMPVSYAGAQAEHHMVRRHCGLFDVSHMGEVEFKGKGALEAANRLITNDLARITDGQAIYSGLLNPVGLATWYTWWGWSASRVPPGAPRNSDGHRKPGFVPWKTPGSRRALHDRNGR